jgi:hypothetical protein
VLNTIYKLVAWLQALPAKLRASKACAAVSASVHAYRWIWAGGGVVVLAGLATLVVVYGGLFGPSGRAICKVAIERTTAYGVLPLNAKQDGSAESTDVRHRKACNVTVEDEKYVVTVDLKCDNLKEADCLPIYSVERADGMSLYQVRALPDDDNGNPLPVTGAAAAAPAPTVPGVHAVAGPAQTSPGAAVQNAPSADGSDVEVSRPAQGQ